MTPTARLVATGLLVSLSLGCGARAISGGNVPIDTDAAGVDVVQGGSDAGFFPTDTLVAPTDRGLPSLDIGVPRDTGFRTDVVIRVDLGSPVDSPRPVDAGSASRTSVVAGRRCTDDSMCATPSADLSCLPLPGGSICSGPELCEQGTTAQEEAQCGGRFSTCLVIGNFEGGGQASVCTRACVPTASTEATGACPSGSICTNNWLQLMAGQTETPGCLPHCVSDADCVGVSGEEGPLDRCNVRTGRCATAPVDLALRADGLACNPDEARRTMVNPCRGICFSLSATAPTQGLCGSFIDQRTASGCADSPDLVVRAPMGDSLGICIFRGCENNSQCPAGLLCAHPEDSSGVRTDVPATCAYGTPMQPVGIPAPGADAGTIPPG